MKAITVPNGVLIVKSCTSSIFEENVINVLLTVVYNIDYSSGRTNKVYADFDDIYMKISDAKNIEEAIEKSISIYIEFKDYLQKNNGCCPEDKRKAAGIEKYEPTFRKFFNLKELSDELEIPEEILRSKQKS